VKIRWNDGPRMTREQAAAHEAAGRARMQRTLRATQLGIRSHRVNSMIRTTAMARATVMHHLTVGRRSGLHRVGAHLGSRLRRRGYHGRFA
jgi:hypothetical protein